VAKPAAILDVDGTLVDTNYQHALAWYRAFRQHGVVLPIYLDLLDARGLVEGWTTSGDVEKTKPEPDLVAAAVEKAGGGKAVMVGDSTWDCESAKRAGLKTVGVLMGGFSEQELLDAGAACVFDSLAALRLSLAQTPLG
jgi:phosphoglycolate phosphatase-like HAD superfamily hydrolase